LENRIDGAVLALFDIAEATRRYDLSAAARAGDGNRGSAKEPGEIGIGRSSVAAILESVRDPMIILDDEHQIVEANQPFADAIGESPENLRGRSVYGLGEGAWDSPELRTLLETELAQHRVVESFALRLPAAQGDGSRDAVVSARRVSGGDGRRPLLVLAFQLP
jgi:two-component system CheB/CheR fusion protein